jgi:hypothetical protein
MSELGRRDDERLGRLLASVHAEADPALWTRTRARIEAQERRSGWLVWVMRPMALGAACALLVVSMVASLALVTTSPRTITAGSSEDLTEALVAELGDVSVASGSVTPTTPATVDSGASR